MGYRDFAKDYEIEYVERPGKKRPKAVRIYVGPYFRFAASAERIRKLRWFYTLGLILTAVLMLIPMAIDCAFTRTWYIQVPAAAAWIPWVLALGALWRLWTAKELVDREHYELLYNRMSGSCLFLMGFCIISAVGCIVLSSQQKLETADALVCACCILSSICGMALFSKRKELDMIRVENPEKRQAKKD